MEFKRSNQNEIQELVNIDSSFNLLMVAVEKVLKIKFDVDIVGQVFQDYRSGSQYRKHYRFFSGELITIEGRVDDSYPDTIWIKVKGSGLHLDSINKIFKEYHISFGMGILSRTKKQCESHFKKRTENIIEWNL